MSVRIANLALARVGTGRIESFEDADAAAVLVRELWPQVRDAELRAHTWGCATARSLLAASTEVPAFGFARSFPLPADCLRVLEVGEGGARSDWRVEGRAVLADAAPPLALRYVRRLDDDGEMDASLVDVLALRLAAAFAPRLTQSASAGEGLERDYKEALRRAKRLDAIENPPQAIGDALDTRTWLEARR
ncbi:MAG: hypothetical protein KDG89_06765 [Geminicoccaceae bacterium]|nr:hypothetical protein [Geminicoccaceae bacterium]